MRDREELFNIMNDLSQGILTNSLGAWREEQASESSETERKGNEPTGDTVTARVPCGENVEKMVEEGPPPPPEGHCIQNDAEANPPGPCA